MNFTYLTSTSGSTGAGRAAVIGGDEAALREFVAQMTGAFGLIGETTVYVGQLPPQALDIPLPPGTHITGSIVRGISGFEILTLIDTPVEQAHAACEQLFLANGWQRIEDSPHGLRGFVDSPLIMSRYCHASAKASLFINAGAAGNGSTTLRLNVSHDPNPCAPRGMGGDLFKYLPNLQTPSGAKLTPGSQSGGGNPGTHSVSSSAVLASQLSLRELAQAYHQQFSALGWEQVSTEIGERFATSSWIMTQDDARWSAFFTLAADPITPNEYPVWLHLLQHAE